MAPDALAAHGVIPTEVVPAKLSGFELRIRPRVNLIRSDRTCVYGMLAAITHTDIAKLYSHIDECFKMKYLPEPVIAEELNGMFRPALCYVAPNMDEDPAEQVYVDQLSEIANNLKFPEWYVSHIKSFGRQGRNMESSG